MQNNQIGKQTPVKNEQPSRLDSRALMSGQREVIIAHGDDEYRLRVTRQGKLILTK